MAPEATETPKGERLARKSNKQRTLELIKSLVPDDDERTALSKKISWILRHGTQKVNVKADPDGWVKVSDLLGTEILEEVSKDTLMATIVDSNAHKLRYKLKDSAEGQLIRAYSKNERKAASDSLIVPSAEPNTRAPGVLRQEAPAFVPSGVSAAAGLPQMGFPWPVPGYGFPPMMPGWPASGYPGFPPFMMEGGASAGLPPGRYRGRIKSFNPEKGFGFIECSETYQQFNRDVFLHKAQCGDMAVGTEVTFIVETNKQGMPQAKELQPLGAAGVAGGGGGKGKGGKGSKGVKGGGKEGKSGRGQGKGGRSDRSSKGGGKPSQEPVEPGAVAPKTAAPAEAVTGPATEAATPAEPAPAAAVTAPAAEVEAAATAEAPPAAGAPAA